MKTTEPMIKLAYIFGLRRIVLDEVCAHKNLSLVGEGEDSVFIKNGSSLDEVKKLRSIARAYLVRSGEMYGLMGTVTIIW